MRAQTHTHSRAHTSLPPAGLISLSHRQDLIRSRAPAPMEAGPLDCEHMGLWGMECLLPELAVSAACDLPCPAG